VVSRLLDRADSRCGEIRDVSMRLHGAIIDRPPARNNAPLGHLPFIWLNASRPSAAGHLVLAATGGASLVHANRRAYQAVPRPAGFHPDAISARSTPSAAATSS
jgi:hypothetical protein